MFFEYGAAPSNIMPTIKYVVDQGAMVTNFWVESAATGRIERDRFRTVGGSKVYSQRINPPGATLQVILIISGLPSPTAPPGAYCETFYTVKDDPQDKDFQSLGAGITVEIRTPPSPKAESATYAIPGSNLMNVGTLKASFAADVGLNVPKPTKRTPSKKTAKKRKKPKKNPSRKKKGKGRK